MVMDPSGAGLAREIARVSDPDPEGGASSYEDACQRLLHLLRRHVGMEVAWTSEFVGTHQVFRFVDHAPDAPAPEVGSTIPLQDAYCSRVLAGAMPALIPNVRTEPTAVWLDVTYGMYIGSYVGVPLHSLDGTPNGMLCMVSTSPDPSLDEHDLTTARLVSQVLDDLHHRALGEAAARRERETLLTQVDAAVHGAGRHCVLQPIVDVATGAAVAAEGLTRFDDDVRTTSGWFAAADKVGMRQELEAAAARGILATLESPDPPPAVAVNLSPDTVTERLPELVDGHDLRRVTVEITEYLPVPDYDLLEAVLTPLRRRGMRLAVDDAGAGYASMSHVLRLRPDMIKIDMSLVRDVDTDPIRQALIGALVRFSAVAGATVVAEGVETYGELDSLIDLGVPLAQGFVFGHPTAHPDWQGFPHRADRAPMVP